MKKALLLLGVLFYVTVSVAQLPDYHWGQMQKWDTQERTYHGVTRKMVVYYIKYSMTTYIVTQGTMTPSALASRKFVDFRIDKRNSWVMYTKDKSEKEVRYSIVSIGSWAR